MRRRGLVFLLLVLGVLWFFPESGGLSGHRQSHRIDGTTAVVRDGDTFTVGEQDYRLNGIDAPEFRQSCKTASGTDWPCGQQARTALADLVKSGILTCEERARDKYDRIIATCRDSRGNDIASAMIKAGFAVSPGEFERGAYAAEEAIARSARRGLWQGAFDPPASWRAAHPRTPIASRLQWIHSFSEAKGDTNLA